MAKTGIYRQNESIFEIRYKPNAKLIDHRGKWAEEIADHLKLKHWKVDANRIDIFDDKDETHLFLSYKNCGMTLSLCPKISWSIQIWLNGVVPYGKQFVWL